MPMDEYSARVRAGRAVASAQADEVSMSFRFGGVGFGRGTPVGMMMGHVVFGLVCVFVFVSLI